MPIDHFTIRRGEDWHGESELANACPNPVDSLVVLTWIAFVRLQPFDGPVFDAESFRGGGRRRTLLRRVLTTDPITRGHIFSTIIAPQSTCRTVLYDTE